MKQRSLTPTGKVIVKRLIDLNRTQVWLCQQLGMNKSYLSRILHGERSGDMYLPKIFELLDLSNEQYPIE